jgi:branched-chain amino acid aminotransferase
MYYSDDTIIFLDGQFIKAKDARVDLFGQTLHYGYGAFEGIRSYRTVNGTKIFKAAEHFERLKKSCELVGIPLRQSVNEMTQISYHILEKNKLSNAYIRPLVFCSPNMSLSAPKEVSLMIAAWEWARYFGVDQLVKLCVSTIQRPNPKSVKMEAKVCGHYVNSVMATMEAKERGFDEALMLDMDGFVAECSGANVFMEKDNVLYTPSLGNILPGITRKTVIDICRELDIQVKEKLFKPEEMFTADSAFLCGTAAEIAGVESLDGHMMRKPWRNSLGCIIQEAYKCLVLDKSYSYVIV